MMIQVRSRLFVRVPICLSCRHCVVCRAPTITDTRHDNTAHNKTRQCRNSGWVGVGFHADEATMKNADIHICRRWANDTWEFIDAYALDVGPPTRDQTLSGGSNNLFDTSAEYDGGVVTCRFSKCASPLGREPVCVVCCAGARADR